MPAVKAQTIVVLPSELRYADWIQLAWGFFWRGLIVSAASGVCGAILGAIIGFFVGIIMAIAGVPQESYLLPLQVLSGLLGLALGFFFLIPLIKWLLNSNFGAYRLQLTRTKISDQLPSSDVS